MEPSGQDECRRWCACRGSPKLGLKQFDETLFSELARLMLDTSVDYTIFFRELSKIPEDWQSLENSFYQKPSEVLKMRWEKWLSAWNTLLRQEYKNFSSSDISQSTNFNALSKSSFCC